MASPGLADHGRSSLYSAVILAVYTAINVWLGGKAWDPYPFILLNLFLSMLAAIQAPVIMMSQNRQDTKDRLRSELDFDVNRRSETEIQGLARKLNLLDEKVGDVYQLLKDAKRIEAKIGGEVVPLKTQAASNPHRPASINSKRHNPRRMRAARTVFDINMAIVSRPTPPGTGV